MSPRRLDPFDLVNSVGSFRVMVRRGREEFVEAELQWWEDGAIWLFGDGMVVPVHAESAREAVEALAATGEKIQGIWWEVRGWSDEEVLAPGEGEEELAWWCSDDDR